LDRSKKHIKTGNMLIAGHVFGFFLIICIIFLVLIICRFILKDIFYGIGNNFLPLHRRKNVYIVDIDNNTWKTVFGSVGNVE